MRRKESIPCGTIRGFGWIIFQQSPLVDLEAVFARHVVASRGPDARPKLRRLEEHDHGAPELGCVAYPYPAPTTHAMFDHHGRIRMHEDRRAAGHRLQENDAETLEG